MGREEKKLLSAVDEVEGPHDNVRGTGQVVTPTQAESLRAGKIEISAGALQVR